MTLAMPQELLIGTVVFGVSGVVILTWLLGWNKRRPLNSVADAAAALALSSPDDVVTDGIVADDGLAALLAVKDGDVALVTVLGDKTVVRSTRGCHAEEDAKGLRLLFANAGGPRVYMALAEASTRQTWLARLRSSNGRS